MQTLPFIPDPGNRNVRAQKHALRLQLGHRRLAIPADLHDTTRWKATNHLRSLLATFGPGIVALYYPRKGEIDLRPLAEELWANGSAVALPRVVYPGHPLTFNLWHKGAALEPDAVGIPAATGDEVIPASIVIPMLGYNRKGYRLGSGGGYYDATLKNLPYPAATVGICHTELEIPTFPSEYHDQRLGYIVTGREVIVCI